MTMMRPWRVMLCPARRDIWGGYVNTSLLLGEESLSQPHRGLCKMTKD